MECMPQSTYNWASGIILEQKRTPATGLLGQLTLRPATRHPAQASTRRPVAAGIDAQLRAQPVIRSMHKQHRLTPLRSHCTHFSSRAEETEIGLDYPSAIKRTAGGFLPHRQRRERKFSGFCAPLRAQASPESSNHWQNTAGYQRSDASYRAHANWRLSGAPPHPCGKNRHWTHLDGTYRQAVGQKGIKKPQQLTERRPDRNRPAIEAKIGPKTLLQRRHALEKAHARSGL